MNYITQYKLFESEERLLRYLKSDTQKDIEMIISDTMSYLLDDNINRNDEIMVDARIYRVQRASVKTDNRNVYHIYIEFNNTKMWSDIKDYLIVFLQVLKDNYELRYEFLSAPDSDITLSIVNKKGNFYLNSDGDNNTFYLNSDDIIEDKLIYQKIMDNPIRIIKLAVYGNETFNFK